MSAQLPRLTVLGTGYLGATHAICMAVLGYEVLGVDIDRAKVDGARRRAEVPFYEPGLPELLRKALDSGRLRFTTDLAEAAEFGDVHFVCVGTPQLPGSNARRPQLRRGGGRPAWRRTCAGRCLVVGKSTVPVGTAARLTAARSRSSRPPARTSSWPGTPSSCARASRSRTRCGRTGWSSASASARAEDTLRDGVRGRSLEAGSPVVVTDLATAELVKVAANSFLATKISFINAMAEVCEATGADVSDLADALGHDARIGGRFLKPGSASAAAACPRTSAPSCTGPRSSASGRRSAFLREVDAINRRRRERDGRPGPRAGGGDAGRRHGCACSARRSSRTPTTSGTRRRSTWPGCCTRRAPTSASTTRRRWTTRGAPTPTLRYADSVLEAAPGRGVVVLLTEWDQFKALDPTLARAARRDPRGRRRPARAGPAERGAPPAGPTGRSVGRSSVTSARHQACLRRAPGRIC